MVSMVFYIVALGITNTLQWFQWLQWLLVYFSYILNYTVLRTLLVACPPARFLQPPERHNQNGSVLKGRTLSHQWYSLG